MILHKGIKWELLIYKDTTRKLLCFEKGKEEWLEN